MRLSCNKAALACCTLLLVCHTGGALAGAGPLKTPTARKGDCFNNMTAEIKKADDAAQVGKASFLRGRRAELVAAAAAAAAAAACPRVLSRGAAWDGLAACPNTPPHKPFLLLPPQGYGIIFYGDSITETLRGTDKCRPCESRRRSGCDGVPQLLKQNYGKYRPGVMGMSMDESAHLLWRLMNGQIPKKNFVSSVA